MTEPTRAGYIAGLRALADVLEQHDEVPLPYDGTIGPIGLHFLYGEDPRASMVAAVRALPGTFDKHADDTYYSLDGQIEGLRIRLTAIRDDVCQRVVVGTETVTKTVPDPEALAAVPKVEVTETVEVVEWRCGSLLAGTTEPTGPAATDIEVGDDTASSDPESTESTFVKPAERSVYEDPAAPAAIRSTIAAQRRAEHDDTTGSAS